MNALHKRAQRIAQWAVDAVMGNGLAQKENSAEGEASVTPGMPELARRAAAEGCVLLKNDGTLPLSKTEEFSVFGRCQIDWFYMGHGSGGDVHPPYSRNLLDGLDVVGLTYNRQLAEVYRAFCGSEANAANNGFWGHWPTHHPEMPVGDELLAAASQTSKVALVVIGRTAGEDMDLPIKEGGYYLTKEEHSLLDAVTEAFEHTVVVLNISNAMDLSWIEAYGDKLSAALIAWQGGMEAGSAVADVLSGDICPSGRVPMTFARTYNAYPTSGFGEKQVPYLEDVFVGYRHFCKNAPDTLLYPMGYGLSYTSFSSETISFAWDDGVEATIRVSNTGEVAGREVVLLWCAIPEGTLEQPTSVLVGFAKTDVLEPGDAQDVRLSCDTRCFCSFDQARSAFVLVPGTYGLWTGQATGDTRTDVGTFDVDELRVVEQCHVICSDEVNLRSRIMAQLPLEVPSKGDQNIMLQEVANGTKPLNTFLSQLTSSELEALSRGEGSMNSLFGPPGNAGAFGGTTQELRSRGVPPIICADGPSGLRLQSHCSLVPSATTLASTWNVALVQELYECLGHEAKERDIDVLLGPGMNIQRNPLCGRNFEYFSEDPLLSGRMAAAVVRGLQSGGVSACPKHFAANNQEARRNTSDSIVSQRALREIYLRGFEICVREAAPDLMMTSYNKVNGVWAHYNFDLATTVLRDEWGFEGVVITDWWMKRARSPEFHKLRNNAYRIRAGVDVLMPGSMSHVLRVIQPPEGITLGEMQRTARRVLAYAVERMPESDEAEVPSQLEEPLSESEEQEVPAPVTHPVPLDLPKI